MTSSTSRRSKTKRARPHSRTATRSTAELWLVEKATGYAGCSLRFWLDGQALVIETSKSDYSVKTTLPLKTANSQKLARSFLLGLEPCMETTRNMDAVISWRKNTV